LKEERNHILVERTQCETFVQKFVFVCWDWEPK